MIVFTPKMLMRLDEAACCGYNSGVKIEARGDTKRLLIPRDWGSTPDPVWGTTLGE
jgi:hypothetical protein